MGVWGIWERLSQFNADGIGVVKTGVPRGVDQRHNGRQSSRGVSDIVGAHLVGVVLKPVQCADALLVIRKIGAGAGGMDHEQPWRLPIPSLVVVAV